MTRVRSLISSRVSRSLRSTSSSRATVRCNGALVGDDEQERRVLFPNRRGSAQPPDSTPKVIPWTLSGMMAQDWHGLAKPALLRVITGTLSQCRPVNRFADGQEGPSSNGTKPWRRSWLRSEVPESYSVSRPLPSLLTTLTTRATAPSPTARDEGGGFHYLGDPVAVGKARNHFRDDGEASDNRKPSSSSGYLRHLSAASIGQPRPRRAAMRPPITVLVVTSTVHESRCRTGWWRFLGTMVPFALECRRSRVFRSGGLAVRNWCAVPQWPHSAPRSPLG